MALTPALLKRNGTCRAPRVWLHPAATCIGAVPTPTNAVPSPYHRRTNSSAPSDFAMKSEGAAAMVLSWYGEGVEEGWRK